MFRGCTVFGGQGFAGMGENSVGIGVVGVDRCEIRVVTQNVTKAVT